MEKECLWKKSVYGSTNLESDLEDKGKPSRERRLAEIWDIHKYPVLHFKRSIKDYRPREILRNKNGYR